MDRDFNFFDFFNNKKLGKKITNYISVSSAIMPLLVILAIGLNFYIKFQVENKNEDLVKEIEQIQLETDKLVNGGKIEKNEELRIKRDDLQETNKIIKNKTGEGFQITYKHLLGINNSLPIGIFLEKIELLNPIDGKVNQIVGYAMNNTSVADFQNNLRNNKNFTNTYVKEIIYDLESGFEFVVYLDLERGVDSNEN